MTQTTVNVSIVVSLPPETAFDLVVTELERSLSSPNGAVSMRLERGPRGRVVEVRPGHDEALAVGTVGEWQPGERITLKWRAADWGRNRRTEVELRCEPVDGGTRITLEHRGWGQPIIAIGRDSAAGGAELVGWFADQLLAPAFRATAPSGLAKWLTDRRARRPAGPRARETYRYPAEHQEGYTVTLEALDLSAGDALLEIGCGGGAFMSQALQSGCRAVAVDHSDEMVGLCSETNAEAIASGQLGVLQASAESLPFGDGEFTAVAMTHMFFFLPDGAAALREARRVLSDRGRLAIYTIGPELQGTPAAPEPIVRQMRFYSDRELVRMAHDAGFSEATVDRVRGAQLLRVVV